MCMFRLAVQIDKAQKEYKVQDFTQIIWTTFILYSTFMVVLCIL